MSAVSPAMDRRDADVARAPSSEPIFVVGVSRSGTTLLAAMLNAHSRIYCGPETFFFARLAKRNVKELLEDRHWPEKAVQFLSGLRLGSSGVPVQELFGHTTDQLSRHLSETSPSVGAMLESLVVSRAAALGKVRWAEKTPNHLLFLQDIRRYYPSALILRIVRDPRDVALSLTRVPFGSHSKLANLYLWRSRDEHSWQFFERDRHCHTVQYEQLLSNPARELDRICARIGERFEPGMLQPNVGAEQMMASAEWWKGQVLRPLDGTNVSLWRSTYSPQEARVADLLCRPALERYGYPHEASSVRTCLFTPLTRAFIERNESVFFDLADRGIALHPLTRLNVAAGAPASAADPVLFWGLPGQLHWSLGTSTRQRLNTALRLARFLAVRKMRQLPAYWVAANSNLDRRSGTVDAVCTVLLRFLGKRVAPADAVAQIANSPKRQQKEEHP